MHHSFVSYSRSDAAWVQQLVARLEQHGVRIWIDRRDIPVTVPWMDEVRDAITEADLFLCCDSPAFQSSDNCRAETDLAAQAGKPQLKVAVAGDVAEAESNVLQSWRHIAPERFQRTELAVLSRDWDRAGRPRGGLVSWQVRQRLMRALQVGIPATAIEQTFLRQSRSRSLRRTAAAVTAAVVLTAGVTAFETFNQARTIISNDNSSQAAIYTTEQTGLQDVINDPYAGLAAAARLGGNDSAAYAAVLDSALHDPVPDDAFTVPGLASHFAASPVGSEVVVASGSGQEWGRLATATGTRRAEQVIGTGTPVLARASSLGVSIRRGRRSGAVSVLVGHHLWRHLPFAGPVNALSLSSDGRNLAAASAGIVQIADVRAGLIRMKLRGAPGTILDLAWSANGQRIWGLTRGKVVSWDVGAGIALIDDPAVTFEAVLPAAVPNTVWAVSQAGVLTEINVLTRRVLAVRHVPGQVDSAAASPDGKVAALSGQNRDWIARLSGKPALRSVAVPGCRAGRPAFGNDATFYLPCLGGDLLTISVPTATVIKRTSVSVLGVFAARVLPGAGEVLAGDENGHLYAVTSAGVTELWRSQCNGSIDRIAVTSSGDTVLPVGAGTGMLGCTEFGSRNGGDPADPGDWTWNNMLDDTSSFMADTAVFSPDGRVFAIGYSDGTIIVHPTRELLPAITMSAVDGHIRDMLVLASGDLIAATDAGLLQRIPLCSTCLSNKALAEVAATRLAQGVRLGLAVSRPR